MKNPATKRDACGTTAGWNAHTRYNERQCMACKVAHTEYQREWRHRTGRSQSKLYTNDEIFDMHAAAKNEISERVRAGIKLLYPDDMTPTAKRVLEQILDGGI